MLGRVVLPGTHFDLVTAAADDRTFVLAASRRAPKGVTANPVTQFYRLTLTASGRAEPLVRLPLTIPAVPGHHPAGGHPGARQHARPAPGAAGPLESALVTGHGRLLVAWAEASGGTGPGRPLVPAEFSLPSGQRLRVLDILARPGEITGDAYAWPADPSGQHLLVSGSVETGTVPSGGGPITDAVAHLIFYRVDRGRITPLPDPAGQHQLAAAW